MNILYISQYFSFEPTHAAEVTTYEIVKRLTDKGHQVTVFVPNISSEVKSEDSGSSGKVHVHALTHFSSGVLQENPLLRLLTVTLWYIFLVMGALKSAKGKRFNVVIAMYHPSHLATVSAYVICRILRLRLIIKEHDLIPWLTDPSKLRRMYAHAAMLLNIQVMRRGDLILVQSDYRKSFIREIYGVSEKKLFLFPNGVDIKEFTPSIKCTSFCRKLNPRNNKILLYIGMISGIVGLDNVVRALPIVIKEYPRIELLIVGEGPEKGRLINLAKRLKVDDHIRFLGCAHHDRIPRFISLADIAVGPLKSGVEHGMSFPLKVLEYMACGKPVVARHGGVSRDLIINGYNGILVSDGNVAELARVVLRLIGDEKFVKAIGRNARRHVEKFHDWNHLIIKLDRIIREQTMRSDLHR